MNIDQLSRHAQWASHQ